MAWMMPLMLAVLIVQRLVEIRIANQNRSWALANGGIEHGADHYKWFFPLHIGWMVGWLVEGWLRRGGEPVATWWLWLTLFVGAQLLRYWAIRSLGQRWNTRIIVFGDKPPLAKGPYQWLRHPNYVAVAIELLAVPLLFGAWTTALLATVLNAALLLGIRIPAEERALGIR